MPKRNGLRDDDVMGRLEDIERRLDRADEQATDHQDRLLVLETGKKPAKKE